MTEAEFARLERKNGRVNAERRRDAVKPPDAPDVAAWLEHIASIEEKAEAGCTFRMDDLTEAEWRGRALLKRAREKLSERYRSCPGCGKAILRLATGHDLCGWQERKP